MLTCKEIETISALLERVDLRGSEALAYVEVQQALGKAHAEAKVGEDDASGNS